MRAVMYPRVSTDIQRGNYSIASQIKDMMAYAHDRGYTLVGDMFVDPVTGQDAPKGKGVPAYVDDYTSTELSRPGLNACLVFLNTTGFDVMIAHAVDRLARDPYFRQTIEREVANFGAKVEYVLGNYEESAEGEVRKDLDATFAKWENAKRVERSNRGKMRKAEIGKFVAGYAPFGYRVDLNALGGLVIFEPEAQIVREIYEWYIESRLSLSQVARELNARGVPTAQKGKKWTASSIAHLLKNTAYVGYVYYNKTKKVNGKRARRERSEWVKIECQPLTSQDVFEAARDLLKHNKEYRRKHSSRFYLLSGLVFCSECERVYAATILNPGNGRDSRQGYRHRISQGHCINRVFSARFLEPLVWEQVTQILLNPKSLRKGYQKMMEEEEGKYDRQMRHLEVIRSGIEKLEAKKRRLQAVYLDPDIGMSKGEYLSEKKLLEEQIAAAYEDIDRIESELKKVPTEEDLQSLEELAGEIVTALGNNLDIPPEDKRNVMEMLHIKVIISPEKNITVEGWFSTDGLLSTSYSGNPSRPTRRFQAADVCRRTSPRIPCP